MLPQELTAVEVHADDLNFDAPTVQFVTPHTVIHHLFYGVLAALGGFLFVEVLTLSTAMVLQATSTPAYRNAVYATARELRFACGATYGTARELRSAFITFFIIARAFGRAVCEQTVRGGLRVVAFFQDIQHIEV